MKLRCCSFEELKKRISGTNIKKLLLFGTGVIGQVTVPEILRDYNLLKYVDCYLDNDGKKCGGTVSACGMNFEIRSPQYLESCPPDAVILLNISRFPDVLEQLDAMECTWGMECYMMPMMLIHNYCSSAPYGKAVMGGVPLIPKKLHYMWLGGKPVPENLEKCIESWKKYCPDYEIIEWNENNYDLEKHPYMKQAYEAGAYGFVPDYARLDIIYREGGIYLDTDVELRRNIDGLLCQEAFCGVEKWQTVNFGGLGGAVKGHPMIKKFLDARREVHFVNPDGSQNRNTCGFYDTRVAIREGYKISGKTQFVNGMNIYAYDYFHPYDYMSGVIDETEHTYSVHWFNGGWLDGDMKKANEESERKYSDLYLLAVDSV